MNSISLSNLTKKFGDFSAVDSVSLDVESGELFGLLGPNGAGKTTIINMLTTLMAQTAGNAIVAGFNTRTDPDSVRRNIGVIFQEPSLDIGLTGEENLDFHAMMYGIGSVEREKRIAEVLSVVGLTDKADILVEKYSGGMKRRLEIARGLIHYPKVLFLDEPTLGLDAQTRRKIWEYIKYLNREYAMTIVLTTHYMEEADFLCDRVAVIDHGKIIASDTPDGLKKILEGDLVSLENTGDPGNFVSALKRDPWVREVHVENLTIFITINDGEKRIPKLLSMAQSHGLQITSVNLRKPSLEDVFIHLTGSNIREQDENRISSRHESMTRRMRR